MVWNIGKRVDGFEAEPLKDTHSPRAVVYNATFDDKNRVVAGLSAGISQAWKIDY